MANESQGDQGGWNSLNQFQNKIIFSICVIAAILHFLLWFQMFIHKIKFELTILFSLGYVTTDIFLLSSYFIQYSIRTRSWIPITRIFCCFEAYSIFYINLFQTLSLTALNICRYMQIVRNQNVYTECRQKLIISFIIVLLLVLINIIIQDIFGWSLVIEESGSSCTLTYTNTIVKIWNITVIVIIPIFISFYMLFLSIYFLQNTNAQQTMMRRNHHHRLILHSLIFYSIWLSLWLPWILCVYLNVDAINESIEFFTFVASTLEILVDPLIAIFLDRRFAQAWEKSFYWIKCKVNRMKNVAVHPTVEMATIHQDNTRNPVH